MPFYDRTEQCWKQLATDYFFMNDIMGSLRIGLLVTWIDIFHDVWPFHLNVAYRFLKWGLNELIPSTGNTAGARFSTVIHENTVGRGQEENTPVYSHGSRAPSIYW